MIRYLLRFYVTFVIAALPALVALAAVYVLDVFLPLVVALVLVIFGFVTLLGVSDYRRKRRRVAGPDA